VEGSGRSLLLSQHLGEEQRTDLNLWARAPLGSRVTAQHTDMYVQVVVCRWRALLLAVMNLWFPQNGAAERIEFVY
jgi:hypothetical protein